jgi:hypothetical protein
MAFIAVAAVEFGAIRALSDYQFRALALTGFRQPPSNVLAALILGALPMANVLVIGLLIGRWRPGSRPFLWGFEAFGAAALAFYIAGMSLFTRELFEPFLEWNRPLLQSRFYLGPASALIKYFLLGAMLVLPQVAFGMIGGCLSHRLRRP